MTLNILEPTAQLRHGINELKRCLNMHTCTSTTGTNPNCWHSWTSIDGPAQLLRQTDFQVSGKCTDFTTNFPIFFWQQYPKPHQPVWVVTSYKQVLIKMLLRMHDQSMPFKMKKQSEEGHCQDTISSSLNSTTVVASQNMNIT